MRQLTSYAFILLVLPACAPTTVTNEQIAPPSVAVEDEAMPHQPSSASATTYTNDEYGFSFRPFQEWEGYDVQVDTTGAEDLDGVVQIDVGFPTTDAAYGEDFAGFVTIVAYTPAQWKTIQSFEGPKPSRLGENSRYIFGFWAPQAFPADRMDRVVSFDENLIRERFSAFEPR